MSYEADVVLRGLRNQAWERAKGELNSMLTTFYDRKHNSRPDQYDGLKAEIKKFVEKVESEGLHE